jgi:hypothetical protein
VWAICLLESLLHDGDVASSETLAGWFPWPRWAFMWGLAVVIFFGCKCLTGWRGLKLGVGRWRRVGYFLAWPGMDAGVFFDRRLHPAKPYFGEWLFGLMKLVVGFIVLFGVARRIRVVDPYWTGWVGMIGIVMILHFGLFHLLSCGWRSVGVEARPLMNWPGASVRLADFWGRRWNTAFRDLTHRFLFRPLTRRIGARGALVVGFLVSGLIHDLVISFPAGGGYGGPTLFFVLQGAGLLIERSAMGRRMGLGRGVVGWVFAMLFLILPAPLLFHRPFVVGIMVPFMQAIGAI